VCVIRGRRRRQATRVEWRFRCPGCGKDVKSPLTHVCRSKRGDFGRRRAQFGRQQEQARKQAEKEAAKAARRPRPVHDHLTCADPECGRPACTGFRDGRRTGFDEGYETGWKARDAQKDRTLKWA
jgi:hypothetical protein